jgi:hypothetical protein
MLTTIEAPVASNGCVRHSPLASVFTRKSTVGKHTSTSFLTLP